MARSYRAPGRRCRNRGQALVEFALAAPLLIMLVAGVVDIGRGYSQTGVIVSAARQGARHAATNPTDIDTIKARTVEEAWGAGVVIDPATVTVTTPSGTGSGNRVNVSIAYQFTPYVGGVFGINQIRIVRDCSMVIF